MANSGLGISDWRGKASSHGITDLYNIGSSSKAHGLRSMGLGRVSRMISLVEDEYSNRPPGMGVCKNDG